MKVALCIACGIVLGIILDRLNTKKVLADYETQNDEYQADLALKKETIAAIHKRYKKMLEALRLENEKLQRKWLVASRWKIMSDDHTSVLDELQRRGIHRIAVYGFGELGKFLVDECLSVSWGGLDVSCLRIIDKAKHGLSYRGIPVSHLPLAPDVDAVLVATVANLAEVKEYLGAGQPEIIELEEIVNARFVRYEVEKQGK